MISHERCYHLSSASLSHRVCLLSVLPGPRSGSVSHALTVAQAVNRTEHALAAGVPGQERLGVTFVTSVVQHVLSDKEKGAQLVARPREHDKHGPRVSGDALLGLRGLEGTRGLQKRPGPSGSHRG